MNLGKQIAQLYAKAEHFFLTLLLCRFPYVLVKLIYKHRNECHKRRRELLYILADVLYSVAYAYRTAVYHRSEYSAAHLVGVINGQNGKEGVLRGELPERRIYTVYNRAYIFLREHNSLAGACCSRREKECGHLGRVAFSVDFNIGIFYKILTEREYIFKIGKLFGYVLLVCGKDKIHLVGDYYVVYVRKLALPVPEKLFKCG